MDGWMDLDPGSNGRGCERGAFRTICVSHEYRHRDCHCSWLEVTQHPSHDCAAVTSSAYPLPTPLLSDIADGQQRRSTWFRRSLRGPQIKRETLHVCSLFLNERITLKTWTQTIGLHICLVLLTKMPLPHRVGGHCWVFRPLLEALYSDAKLLLETALSSRAD